MSVTSSVIVSQSFSSGRSHTEGSELLGRRLGRVAAGGVLALGPLIVLAQASITYALDRDPVLSTAPLIALLWVAAFFAFRLARRFGRSNSARAFFDDDGFAVSSFVVPAIGVALAGPISTHTLFALPVWLFNVVTGHIHDSVAFDGYVAFALAGTVHVHLLFAIILGLAAQQAAKGEAPAKIPLWPSVLASCFPGLMILFPPVLVYVTGFALSRLFLKRAARWFDDDAASVRA
ncbi:MAG: hypothetical protein Q8O67_31045 [Deltaproteobacteria bacterium]|nr:hypothetical protein [Deltaproteobacteria bacterium]